MPVLIVSGDAELTSADSRLYQTLHKPFTKAEPAHAVADALEPARTHAISA